MLLLTPLQVIDIIPNSDVYTVTYRREKCLNPAFAFTRSAKVAKATEQETEHGV